MMTEEERECTAKFAKFLGRIARQRQTNNKQYISNIKYK
jgi:hypothetical protein